MHNLYYLYICVSQCVYICSALSARLHTNFSIARQFFSFMPRISNRKVELTKLESDIIVVALEHTSRNRSHRGRNGKRDRGDTSWEVTLVLSKKKVTLVECNLLLGTWVCKQCDQFLLQDVASLSRRSCTLIGLHLRSISIVNGSAIF